MTKRYERALTRLSASEQELIIARVEMDCSYEEVPESLGKPTPDAARKAAKRALVRPGRGNGARWRQIHSSTAWPAPFSTAIP